MEPVVPDAPINRIDPADADDDRADIIVSSILTPAWKVCVHKPMVVYE